MSFTIFRVGATTNVEEPAIDVPKGVDDLVDPIFFVGTGGILCVCIGFGGTLCVWLGIELVEMPGKLVFLEGMFGILVGKFGIFDDKFGFFVGPIGFLVGKLCFLVGTISFLVGVVCVAVVVTSSYTHNGNWRVASHLQCTKVLHLFSSSLQKYKA